MKIELILPMALILKLENDIEKGLSNTRTKAIIRRLELSFQLDENKPKLHFPSTALNDDSESSYEGKAKN